MARNANVVYFTVISQQNKPRRHGWMGEFAVNIENVLKVFLVFGDTVKLHFSLLSREGRGF